MAEGASDVGRLPSGRPGGLLGYLSDPEPPTEAPPPKKKALPGPALACGIGWQGWTICLRQWALNHTHTQCAYVASCGHSYTRLSREVEEEGEERGWMACNVSGLSIKW